MQFRALEHADAIERTMFEIYATLHLGTRYNSFETH